MNRRRLTYLRLVWHPKSRKDFENICSETEKLKKNKIMHFLGILGHHFPMEKARQMTIEPDLIGVVTAEVVPVVRH